MLKGARFFESAVGNLGAASLHALINTGINVSYNLFGKITFYKFATVLKHIVRVSSNFCLLSSVKYHG